MLDTTPFVVNLDRPRRLVFNLNTAIMIRNAGGRDASVLEKVGQNEDESPILSVNPENLRLYLWAGLQDDARSKGETLTVEDVGRLLSRRKAVTEAAVKVLAAVAAYNGDGLGES